MKSMRVWIQLFLCSTSCQSEKSVWCMFFTLDTGWKLPFEERMKLWLELIRSARYTVIQLIDGSSSVGLLFNRFTHFQAKIPKGKLVSAPQIRISACCFSRLWQSTESFWVSDCWLYSNTSTSASETLNCHRNSSRYGQMQQVDWSCQNCRLRYSIGFRYLDGDVVDSVTGSDCVATPASTLRDSTNQAVPSPITEKSIYIYLCIVLYVLN